MDAQAADAEGRSAIDIAAAAGRWTLVALLDPARALPVAMERDEDGVVPDRPPLLLLRERLLEGVDAQALAPLAGLLGAAEYSGLLGDAEIARDPVRVTWLLHQGANPDSRTPGTPAPVVAALARGADGIAVLRALFAHGGSPAGGGGLANFLAACVAGVPDPRAQAFAIELLDRGADPFATSAAGDPPVALAVRLHWPHLLQRLITHGVDLDARDSHGMSALHLAAALGRETELKALVTAGAAPDRRAADGKHLVNIHRDIW